MLNCVCTSPQAQDQSKDYRSTHSTRRRLSQRSQVSSPELSGRDEGLDVLFLAVWSVVVRVGTYLSSLSIFQILQVAVVEGEEEEEGEGGYLDSRWPRWSAKNLHQSYRLLPAVPLFPLPLPHCLTQSYHSPLCHQQALPQNVTLLTVKQTRPRCFLRLSLSHPHPLLAHNEDSHWFP